LLFFIAAKTLDGLKLAGWAADGGACGRAEASWLKVSAEDSALWLAITWPAW
jgi:hypothetical protein